MAIDQSIKDFYRKVESKSIPEFLIAFSFIIAISAPVLIVVLLSLGFGWVTLLSLLSVQVFITGWQIATGFPMKSCVKFIKNVKKGKPF